MVDVSVDLYEGKQLLNADKLVEAEIYFSRSCAQAPENPDAWFSLGVCRQRLEQTEAAILAFERAIYFDPGHVAAHNARANALVELGRVEDAQNAIRQALKVDPSSSQTLLNHARLLFQGGFYSEALDSLNRVLESEPNNPASLEIRSIIYSRLGRTEEVLSDVSNLIKRFPEAKYYLLQSSALLVLNRFDEALASAENVLELEPENIPAMILAAMAKAGLNKYGEAEQFFSQAEVSDAKKLGLSFTKQDLNLPREMQLDPLLLYLTIAEKRLENCDWQNRSEYLIALQTYLENADQISASDADVMLLKAVCDVEIDSQLRLELAKHIAKYAAQGEEIFDYKFLAKPERLRVGYLAKSFNEDSNIRNTAGIYALHNRHEFEVFCYSMVPGDYGDFNQHIIKNCDQFTELYPRSEAEAAQKIHDDCIHILIDLDGIGLEYPYKLLSHQIAPIQIGFSNSPYSSGSDFLQYRFTHNLVSPTGAEKLWAEKLIRLPNTHLVDHPQQIKILQRLNRSKMRLPAKGIVFCCFAKPELIEPMTFSCWMKILSQLEDSVLWLMEWDQKVCKNLQAEAEKRGIDPKRLIFAPIVEDRTQHLSRYRMADLYLDTISRDADDDTTDALMAGLPVLSLFGQTMANRMTASKLSMLDFQILICATEEEYCERAVYLATHPDYLEILKRKVQRNVLTKPIFNTQQTVLNLEKAYHECWKRYFLGEEVESFQIEEE